MPENKIKQKLNPEIVSIEIGVRNLRKVTFYPLSAADQLTMTDVLEDVFKELIGVSQGDTEESLPVFFNQVLVIIKENIHGIIKMITDEDPDKLLSDTTNSQLVEIIKYVYETNFEGPIKNLLSLFQKEEEENVWKKSVLSQLLPPSAKPTGTDSNTSIDLATVMEDSPSDK